MENRSHLPIVVGVDASDSARSAACWAADLAAAWRCELHLLHAVPGSADDAAPGWLREIVDAAERAGAGPCRVELVPGGPAEALGERAARARMLVLGSYGEGARSGMLAGSVALALAGEVTCPVAVVRGRMPQVPPPRGGPVVVGVDGSATSHAAALLAADIAGSFGNRLVAVHAWSEVEEGAGGLRRRPEDWGELARQGGAVLAAEVSGLAQLHPGLVVQEELVHDTAVHVLLDRADEARALVVGHRRERAPYGMGLGSTSRALVEFAPCPVVVSDGTG
ncbi:universal stress protein [Pseudonocardia zijingensis]|uniref:Universal stress protein n=1 Tax=Pseudonocardia zijingensis TaxID=153376 RepID=A0ABP4AQC3_9PSEU